MTSYRKAIRFFSLFLSLGLPIAASAATFDVKTLIDTDNSRSTGCNVVTAGGIVSGIDVIVTTQGTVTGATGTVTAVTRQTCVNPVLNQFSSATAVDGGWSVGVSTTGSTAGDVTVESHMGLDVLTMDNIGTPRFVFLTSSGLSSDFLLTPWSWGGGDIVMPHAGRDRAVTPTLPRNILLDGGSSDWAGNVPLANGTAAPPVWRFITARAYAGLHDLFFNFQIHTNPAAPTAHDDNYALGTLGGTLTVATLGVLNNDNPNNQPITASLVDSTQHGTLALAPDGGFTYVHDGSLASQDQFHYVAVGTTLSSNLATVTIDLPGTHPYTFTSADNVTFIDGQANTFQVVVTGKPTPALTVDGALPAGVTFQDNGNGTGTLSGTPGPNTSGTYALVFHADKNKPHSSSQNFTLTVTCPGVTVVNPAVTTGTAGTPFSQTFTQSGGTPPVSFALNTGTLPPGLTLSAAGVLSGTPTGSGTFPITVKVTDVGGCTGVGPTYNLVISCHPVTVNNPATSTGTATVAFSQTFTQSGAVGGATFALNSGALPTGLTLSSAGVLSGTPTQTGSFPITVKVTDGQGCIGVSPTYTLTIGCQTITVTNPATNTGVAAAAFSQTFTSGNTIGAVTYSTASTLPAGLTLSSAGVLSGMPTQTGTFPIVVKATDANGCFGNGATYNLTITCQTITVNNPATNSGTVNVAFSQSFTAPAAIGTKTFTLNSGTLPTGLTLSAAGVLSGTPTQTGSFPITVHVVDANGCSANGPTYTLTIGCQVITVNNPATNTGTVNVAFSQTFTTTNSIGAVTFTTASTLPTGLTLSAAGVLSGTPTQSGTFPIVVHAVDANGCPGNGATYSLTIGCQTITVNNPATATGTVNVAFSQTFTSSNAVGAVTYSTASALPTGLTLSSGGVLSGTPTQSGPFPIVVHAVDANGCSGNGATYTLVIGCQIITVTNPATNTGTVNTVFGQTFTSSNTIGTVTYSTASALPAGLTLSSGGVLSGTPTQSGPFPIVVTATDANGCSGSGATYTLTIGCQTITVNNPATTTGTVNAAFSQSFTAGNTVGTLTFTTASTLPAGLSLSTAGVLSGTPTQIGSFPIVVHVVDGNNCSGDGATYTLVIGCQTITVTIPPTNTATVSTPFTVTFTAGNTIGPVTYTTASTLPAGVTLDSATGVLSGTPTQTGTFPIVVTATDANGCSGNSPTYTLVVGCQVITVSNPATNSSPAGTPISINFTQSGAIGTATFTTGSALPTGLTLDPDGTLHGTPTQGGAFPIAVTVTDSNGCTGTNPPYTLTITCPTITVTNPATSTGTVNVAFSQNFSQTGGIGTTTFALLSGTLPNGLSLATNGTLSGTPTQTGSFPITVRATDANGCTGDGTTYTLVISCQVITVTNPATTTGTVNTAFSQTFTAANTILPTTFSIFSGSLPAGLTFHSATGVLDGTPTQTGSFPIKVRATDANGCTGDGATYTLVVGCQIISVTNPANSAGTVNAAFSETFTSGNTIGAVTYSLNSGTLPAGLSLSTAGVLSGTPTQSGSFPITVKATDANSCFGVSATYTINIACQTITVTNPATNTGTVSVPFTVTFTSANTIGTVTYTTASTLPAGLTLSTAGVLSGTPTQSGSFPIVVKATDSNGCFGNGPTYTLVISCQTITVSNPATTSTPAGTPLSINFTQTGAIGTATFTTASTLPTGLTLATNGTLSGTPSGSGAFPIVVTVTDSNGCTGTNPAYTLTITCPTITVTNPGVSTGTAGVAFSQTFTQVGGQGTITWSINSGTLPVGLTFHTTTGVLDGTPTQTGSFPIVVRATDSNGCTGDGTTYTLVIACQTITVTNPGVSTGTAGTVFSQTFTQSGAIGGATFSLNSGSLPAGLTLSAAGLLSGTPTQTGSFPITVKVTDGNLCTGVSATYTLVIACQTITVTNPATTTGTIQVAFSQTFTQSGAIGGATFSLNSGSLPAGLTLSTAGVLSGTPTVTGSFPITVKVTDGNLCTGVSATYNLVINCQTITVTNPATTTGTVNAPFTQTFTQTGANGTATFTSASTLPAGLTLSTAGVLSGTPTQSGTFPIVVTVTDSNSCTGTSPTYTLIISCQTITVTNPATTTGTVGAAFNQTFTQSGGFGTITWSKSGAIPTGMTFHPTTGVLDGTPTQAGSFPITVTATDSNLCTGTGASYTLVVTCNVITVTNPGVTTGTVDAVFSQTFTQSGGNGTITWSKSGAIPAGTTFNTSTGVLSGTPTAPGTFPITVTATDANGCAGTGTTYTLVIACQTITVTAPGVTTGTVDAAFSQTFTQTGVGTHTPANFTINSGSLPSGLLLSSAGVVSGTPLVPGSFPITVKVTDANGCTGISATYTLVIACQTITVTNPATTSSVFSVALVPANFTFTQTGVGTHTPANFTINSGTLPTGLSLSLAGVLSGTPTQTGTFPITVKVTDANGCTGIGATYNLAITPNVQTDTYGTSPNQLVDNTQAYVTGGATAAPGTPAVQLSGTVLANDFPAGGVSVTAGTFATTQGGSVTIQSDGSFLYTPAVHAAAIASDSFTYTGTSNTGGTATPTSAIGTVNLTLAGRVWYVKNNGGGANGQSQSPFTTLAAAAAASTANDIIFVYNGDGSNSGQNAGITLKDGQQLLGEIVGLTVNTNVLVSAGSRPTIGNSGGAGVTVASSTGNPRGNIVIKGFSLAGTTQGVDITSAGTGTLSATVDNIVVTSATNNGVHIAGAATTSTTVTVQNSVVNAATQNGIDAQQTSAGALVLNINNNSITATVTGININGAGSTSTTITNFAGNSINGNTGGTGINVSTATFDAVPGTVGFDTVSGGNTQIGASGNGVGANGLVLTTVKGDLSFTDLDIFTSAGTGLFASSAATFNSGTGAGFQIVVTGSPSIDATGGPAADLTTVTVNLPFTTIKSATSPTTGVNLATVLGTFTAGVGSTITNATGNDFNITGGTATVTYDGTISDNSGRPVSISGATGGTKSFTGAITNNGGTGISLTTNTGATINFSGNLTLSTGSNTAFNATGGGTVTATNTSSTIVTTTGTGVNINSTTIGGAGVKFLSVSSNGAANGINLNTTGAGPFTVIGDGTASNNGSGGTIQNTTAEGILTSSTGTISLSHMNISNSGTKGISVTGSTGFTLDRSNVTDNAGVATHNGVHLINNTGTIAFTDDVVDSAPDNQVNIDNFNTNLTAINASNSTFKCTAGNICQPSGGVGADGFLVQIRGTSVLTSANVTGCTMTGNRSTGIQVSATDTATIGSSSGGAITAPAASHSFVIQSCTINNNNAGIDMDQTQHSNHAFELLNNILSFHKSSSINAFAAAGIGFSGSITGYINGNQIGIQGTKDSGSTSNGAGVRMVVQGDSTQGYFTVDNNQIREVPNSDVIIAFSQNGGTPNTGSTSPTRRFKITNNTLPQPSGTNQSLGCGVGVPCGAADGVIWVYADENNTNCALVTGNNVYDATTMNGSWDILLSARTGPPAGASITIQTGANGTSAAAITFLNANNTLNGANKSHDESGTVTAVTSCGSFPP
jgi:large repetitive protein